jgi:hypothetical protein
MIYLVPVAAPQSAFGSGITSNGPPNVGVNYDVNAEFPLDPIRMWIAWANCLWQVTSVYNGK